MTQPKYKENIKFLRQNKITTLNSFIFTPGVTCNVLSIRTQSNRDILMPVSDLTRDAITAAVDYFDISGYLKRHDVPQCSFLAEFLDVRDALKEVREIAYNLPNKK